MTKYDPNISIAGENSLIIHLSETSDEVVADRVQKISALVRTYIGADLIDLVPSYASILVIYDHFKTDHFIVSKVLKRIISETENLNLTNRKSTLVTLPVYYSLESGPDLSNLAKIANLSINEVITIHQQVEYRVYAIGFAPGFAYLGNVDKRIAAPRLSTPRLRVPRGAVAIADQQTAVYPSESPGGWNLIGLCPTLMFDPNKIPSMPVKTGDRVKFKAIERNEFIELGGDVAPARDSL
jgi:KipI family sensor histidine kinase inhibitor